jgi:CxxC motif-containing protein (DUF1111 family)
LGALADPHDRDQDGISGRIGVGRFGWKAEQPSVLAQTAAAFVGDMGLTSRVSPQENHRSEQGIALANGGEPELTDSILASVVFYSRTLAVPAPRRSALAERGEQLFEQSGCARCHVPSLTTRPDVQPRVLASRTIHPYTDLLLHDLGPGLSDGRPVPGAEGSEWRTPPLWGIGLVQRVNGHTFFLHDGRARSLSEAILWHDGEAARAKRRFVHMPRGDRQAMLAFLESL